MVLVLIIVVIIILCVILYFLRRVSRVGQQVVEMDRSFLVLPDFPLCHIFISHLSHLCVQTYSFDLQRPDPTINQFNEPTGTGFEPVYLDDLGVFFCVCAVVCANYQDSERL